MRYRLVCDVEGKLYLRERKPAVSEFDGIRYELIPDNSGQVVQAAVSAQVPDEERDRFALKFDPSPQGSHASIHMTIVATDNELHRRLVEALQRMESLLAIPVVFGPLVRRIRWDLISSDCIPDNESDWPYVGGVARAANDRVVRRTIPHAEFERLVQLSPRLESLRVVNAFWREGVVAVQDSQYIQAGLCIFFHPRGSVRQGKNQRESTASTFRGIGHAQRVASRNH